MTLFVCRAYQQLETRQFPDVVIGFVATTYLQVTNDQKVDPSVKIHYVKKRETFAKFPLQL
jgi:hypothetical protein